jgi:hypothetical protein
MSRSRNIKPGFFTNEVLAELSALTRLLFAGLWTICDRDGRVEDRPKKIRAELLPYDECDADEMLQALEDRGFIARYEACGIHVIQVLAWKKHQNPHVKETASILPPQGIVAPSQEPAPDKNSTSTVQAPDKEQPLPARAALVTDSLLLIPDSSPLIPDSSPLIPRPKPKTVSQAPPAPAFQRKLAPNGASARSPPKPAMTAGVWVAYEAAYRARYGVDPVRNATVNGQLAQLLRRLGHDEAPAVAAWYLASKNAFYVASGHSVANLLRDAEKLRTEWATGRQVTQTQAMQGDKTQTNLNAFAGMLAEAKEREKVHAKN